MLWMHAILISKKQQILNDKLMQYKGIGIHQAQV